MKLVVSMLTNIDSSIALHFKITKYIYVSQILKIAPQDEIDFHVFTANKI